MEYEKPEQIVTNFQTIGTTIGPECFRFGIVILMDNSDHDGQIPISLQTLPQRLHCPTKDGGENTIESTRLNFTQITFLIKNVLHIQFVPFILTFAFVILVLTVFYVLFDQHSVYLFQC